MNVIVFKLMKNYKFIDDEIRGKFRKQCKQMSSRESKGQVEVLQYWGIQSTVSAPQGVGVSVTRRSLFHTSTGVDV